MEGVYVKTEPEPIPHASTSEPPVPLAVPLEAQPCRLCANIPERAIEIYSTEGLSNQLSDRINEYLPVKVSPDDKLPLCCCWTCVTTLLSFHELVVACVEAEKRLQVVLTEPKPIPIPVPIPAVPDPEPEIPEYNDDDAEMMDADDGEGDDDYEPENDDEDEESEEETKPIPGTSDDTEFFKAEEPKITMGEVEYDAYYEEIESGEGCNVEVNTKEQHFIENENERDETLPMIDVSGEGYNVEVNTKKTHFIQKENEKETEETLPVIDIKMIQKEVTKKSEILNEETSEVLRYQCLECRSISTDAYSFWSHYKKAHLNTIKRINEYLLKREAEIKERCKVGRAYHCDRCEATFRYSQSFLEHYALHLPPSERFSNKKLSKVRALEIKTRCRYVKDDKEMFKCYVCGKKMIKLESIMRHVMIHQIPPDPEKRKFNDIMNRCSFTAENDKKKFRCDICGHVLKNPHDFLTHYKKHIAGKKVDKKARAINSNKRTEVKAMCRFVDENGKTAYKCFVCNKVEAEVTFLRHLRKHKYQGDIEEDGTVTEATKEKFERRDWNAVIRQRCTVVDEDGTVIYRCRICKKTTKTSQGMVDHCRERHR